MAFASIVLDIPTRALDGAYGYRIPPELAGEVAVGATVLVDFSHRAAVGYVMGVSDNAPSGVDSEKILDICQEIGELLTLKIENMTVQNMQRREEKREAKKFLYDADRPRGAFAVVAVATSATMQRKFFEMGADVVILSEIAPSSEDFLHAFRYAACDKILVFPNSANSILTSMQAGTLYKNARISVLNCRSMAECYAALGVMDFDGDAADAAASADETFAGVYEVAFYHAIKEIRYGSRTIKKNDFFALTGKELLDVGTSLEATVLSVAERTLAEREVAVLTLFYGKYIAKEFVEHLEARLSALDDAVEIAPVATEETVYDIIITFE
jgi:dihydroxyacetone kinase-like predicted kinase